MAHHYPGQGKIELEKMRTAGLPVPTLTRVRELCIAPATDSRNEGESVLRLTAEFSDGEFRALSYRLSDLLYSLIVSEESIVTAAWNAFVSGDVNENPPGRQTAAPAAAGLDVKVIGQIMTPLVETMTDELNKVRRELAAAHATIKSLEYRAGKTGDDVRALQRVAKGEKVTRGES